METKQIKEISYSAVARDTRSLSIQCNLISLKISEHYGAHVYTRLRFKVASILSEQAISQMITVGFDGSNLFNGQNSSIVK